MALDNLIKLSDDLQNMPLQNVQEYANGSNPEVPSWLAATELQRRASIQQQQEAFQNTNPQTVTQKLLQNLAAPLRQNPAAQGQQVNPAAPQPGIAGLAAPQQAAQQPVQAAHGGLMHLPVNMFKQHNFAPGGIIAFKSGTGDDTVGDATEQQRLANQTAAYVEGAQIAAAQRAADERANSPTPAPASSAKLGQEEDNSSSKYHSVLGRNLSNWLGSAMSGLGQSQANAGLSEAGLPTIVNPPSAAPAAPTAAPAAAPVVPAAAAPATPQATPPAAPPVARRAPPAPPVTPADMAGFYNQPQSPFAPQPTQNLGGEAPIPTVAQRAAAQPAGNNGLADLMKLLPSTPQVKDVPSAEETFKSQLALRRLAGVADNPYATTEEKVRALEAKRALQEAQDPMDRLMAQMAAFATADPTKGFGVQMAHGAETALKLKQEQQALRDKQDASIIDTYNSLAKENTAHRMGLVDETNKGQAEAQKNAVELAKMVNEANKVRAETMSGISNLIQAPASAEYHRAAAGLSSAQAKNVELTAPYVQSEIEAKIAQMRAEAQRAGRGTEFEQQLSYYKNDPQGFIDFKNAQTGNKYDATLKNKLIETFASNMGLQTIYKDKGGQEAYLRDNLPGYASATAPKILTKADIAATVKSSGKTEKEIIDAAKAKGYTIQ